MFEEITPEQANERLQANPEVKLLDVREEWEYERARLPQGILVTQELAREIIEQWPRDTEIICYCHHGNRSAYAALYLAQNGFTRVANLTGGIDAWSQTVDPSIPRY